MYNLKSSYNTHENLDEENRGGKASIIILTFAMFYKNECRFAVLTEEKLYP